MVRVFTLADTNASHLFCLDTQCITDDDIDGQLGNIFTAFSSGLCAGAFVWGVLVDIIGSYPDFLKNE